MGERPRQRRSSRNKRNFDGQIALRKVLLALIALYIVWQGISYTRDIIMAGLIRAEEARYGAIEDVLPVEGTLIRNEKVLPAPRNGKLKILIPEGERVRVGAVVAQVAAPSIDSRSGEKLFNVVAPVAGVVSYETDGLEQVYTPNNLQVLPVSKLRGEELKTVKLADGMQVEEGKPVAKIVNNLDAVNILGMIPREKVPGDMLKPGSRVRVRLSKDQTAPMYLSVVDSSFQGQANLYRLLLRNYSDEFIKTRTITFDMIMKRHEGFIVPAGALVNKDDKLGVYIIYKEAVKWREITLKGQINDEVAVGGLEPGVSVVLNPKYAREGRPFKVP